MKGSRAKKEAEAASSAEGGLEPTPPAEPRVGGPRPGPIVSSDSKIRIPADDFKELIRQLRSSDLLGAAAADAFEAAAGQRPIASPQSKGAKDLRSEVADSREGSPKKKGMNFDAGPVDEIPDLPPEAPKKRASLIEAEADGHDADAMEDHCAKDAPEPPELNLTTKQNKLRTEVEMWVMDELPAMFGVDDSEEIAEILQEDGQADQITFLIAETDQAKQEDLLTKWLAAEEEKTPDDSAKSEFVGNLLAKVRAIQELSPKKKKKKKKDA